MLYLFLCYCFAGSKANKDTFPEASYPEVSSRDSLPEASYPEVSAKDSLPEASYPEVSAKDSLPEASYPEFTAELLDKKVHTAGSRAKQTNRGNGKQK